MKKVVNGKVVNIPNIELFEKAFEGIAMQKLAVSLVGETVPESPFINDCIKHYENTYKSLPFPLYAIEDNIKYAVIGMNIKDKMDVPLKLWVDNGLYIKVDEGKALKFVGNTWAIVTVDKEKEDNTDISLYEGDIGYREFEWALKKLMNGESLKDLYEVFMPEFYKACNGELMLLKWELAHILDFGYVPQKIDIEENRIIDLDNNKIYFMDIYSTGKRVVTGEVLVFRIDGDNSDCKIQKKMTNAYGFDLYEKSIKSDDIMEAKSLEKMRKANLDGVAGLFQVIVGKGNSYGGDISKVRYHGLIADGYLMFEVDGTVYVCYAQTYSKPQKIGVGLSIYSYENGLLYLLKRTLCSNKVYKEIIYSYNVMNGVVKLCKVNFT